MTRVTAVVVVFVAVLAILVGLYATGPKYVVYCDPGHTLNRTENYTGRAIERCVSKYGGSARGTRLRRASAWERIWYAIVGSKNTRD